MGIYDHFTDTLVADMMEQRHAPDVIAVVNLWQAKNHDVFQLRRLQPEQGDLFRSTHIKHAIVSLLRYRAIFLLMISMAIAVVFHLVLLFYKRLQPVH